MNARPVVRVGVIGLGFMGRTHIAAYRAAEQGGYACPLVAVCDADPQRRSGGGAAAGNLGIGGGDALFDPENVRAYATPEELLSDAGVDVVSICTPTETHVDLTIAALAAGKHVLVEKPLALRAADCDAAVAAADAVADERLCMPALCMRFWPGWSWLHERIRAGTFGALRSLTCQRLGSTPGWASFYADAARSGGALVDLHIHDADFIRWCAGDPEAVLSGGDLMHVTTIYRYAGGPAHVAAEGAWDNTPGFPFTMRYVAAFDEATVDFDLAREAPVLVARGGAREPAALEPAEHGLTGYDLEIRHFLDAIAGRCALRATLSDAAAVARLLECERASQERGAAVRVTGF